MDWTLYWTSFFFPRDRTLFDSLSIGALCQDFNGHRVKRMGGFRGIGFGFLLLQLSNALRRHVFFFIIRDAFVAMKRNGVLVSWSVRKLLVEGVDSPGLFRVMHII